jgi:hypothetical protein
MFNFRCRIPIPRVMNGVRKVTSLPCVINGTGKVTPLDEELKIIVFSRFVLHYINEASRLLTS